MTDEYVGYKVGELPSATYQEIKDSGYIPVSTGQGSYKMLASELHDDATECDIADCVFLDTVNGDDSKSGLSRDSAKKTWLAAITLAAETNKWVVPAESDEFDIEYEGDFPLPIRIRRHGLKNAENGSLAISCPHYGEDEDYRTYKFLNDIVVDSEGDVYYIINGDEGHVEGQPRTIKLKGRNVRCGSNGSVVPLPYGDISYEIEAKGDVAFNTYANSTGRAAKSFKVTCGGNFSNLAPLCAGVLDIQAEGNITVNSGITARSTRLVSAGDITLSYGNLNSVDTVVRAKGTLTMTCGFNTMNAGSSGCDVVSGINDYLNSAGTIDIEAAMFNLSCSSGWIGWHNKAHIKVGHFNMNGTVIQSKQLYVEAATAYIYGTFRNCELITDFGSVEIQSPYRGSIFEICDCADSFTYRSVENAVSVFKADRVKVNSSFSYLLQQYTYDSSNNIVYPCNKEFVFNVNVFDNTQYASQGTRYPQLCCNGNTYGKVSGRIGEYRQLEVNKSGYNVGGVYPWDFLPRNSYYNGDRKKPMFENRLFVENMCTPYDVYLDPSGGYDGNTGTDRQHPVCTAGRLLELFKNYSTNFIRVHLINSLYYTLDFASGLDTSKAIDYESLSDPSSARYWVEFVQETPHSEMSLYNVSFVGLSAKGFKTVTLMNVGVATITDIQSDDTIYVGTYYSVPEASKTAKTAVFKNRLRNCVQLKSRCIYFSQSSSADAPVTNDMFGSVTMAAYEQLSFYATRLDCQGNLKLSSNYIYGVDNIYIGGNLDICGNGGSCYGLPNNYIGSSPFSVHYDNFDSLSLTKDVVNVGTESSPVQDTLIKNSSIYVSSCENVSLSLQLSPWARTSNGIGICIECTSLYITSTNASSSSYLMNFNLSVKANYVNINRMYFFGNNLNSGGYYGHNSYTRIVANEVQFNLCSFMNTDLDVSATHIAYNGFALHDKTNGIHYDGPCVVRMHADVADVTIGSLYIDTGSTSSARISSGHVFTMYAGVVKCSFDGEWLGASYDGSGLTLPKPLVNVVVGTVIGTENARKQVSDKMLEGSTIVYLDDIKGGGSAETMQGAVTYRDRETVVIGEHEYGAVKLGDRQWLTVNLHEVIGEEGTDFLVPDHLSDDVYGRKAVDLYGYYYLRSSLCDAEGNPTEAFAALLHDGWRLPNDEDVIALKEFLNEHNPYETSITAMLKAKDIGGLSWLGTSAGNDEFGMGVYPSGFCYGFSKGGRYNPMNYGADSSSNYATYWLAKYGTSRYQNYFRVEGSNYSSYVNCLTMDYYNDANVLCGVRLVRYAENKDGKGGSVPDPKADDGNKVLYGDGTWKENRGETMVGPTAFENGLGGSVPAPKTSDIGKFLNSAGKWESVYRTVVHKSLTTEDEMLMKLNLSEKLVHNTILFIDNEPDGDTPSTLCLSANTDILPEGTLFSSTVVFNSEAFNDVVLVVYGHGPMKAASIDYAVDLSSYKGLVRLDIDGDAARVTRLVSDKRLGTSAMYRYRNLYLTAEFGERSMACGMMMSLRGYNSLDGGHTAIEGCYTFIPPYDESCYRASAVVIPMYDGELAEMKGKFVLQDSSESFLVYDVNEDSLSIYAAAYEDGSYKVQPYLRFSRVADDEKPELLVNPRGITLSPIYPLMYIASNYSFVQVAMYLCVYDYDTEGELAQLIRDYEYVSLQVSSDGGSTWNEAGYSIDSEDYESFGGFISNFVQTASIVEVTDEEGNKHWNYPMTLKFRAIPNTQLDNPNPSVVVDVGEYTVPDLYEQVYLKQASLVSADSEAKPTVELVYALHDYNGIKMYSNYISRCYDTELSASDVVILVDGTEYAAESVQVDSDYYGNREWKVTFNGADFPIGKEGCTMKVRNKCAFGKVQAPECELQLKPYSLDKPELKSYLSREDFDTAYFKLQNCGESGYRVRYDISVSANYGFFDKEDKWHSPMNGIFVPYESVYATSEDEVALKKAFPISEEGIVYSVTAVIVNRDGSEYPLVTGMVTAPNIELTAEPEFHYDAVDGDTAVTLNVGIDGMESLGCIAGCLHWQVRDEEYNVVFNGDSSTTTITLPKGEESATYYLFGFVKLDGVYTYEMLEDTISVPPLG